MKLPTTFRLICVRSLKLARARNDVGNRDVIFFWLSSSADFVDEAGGG